MKGAVPPTEGVGPGGAAADDNEDEDDEEDEEVSIRFSKYYTIQPYIQSIIKMFKQLQIYVILIPSNYCNKNEQ